MALSPYDQQVYDAGFKYIPQSQYLLNPFQIPQGEESEGNVAPGLPAIYQAQGGDGFNPYNMDMSKIRQDYNAFPSRQAGEIYSKTFNPQSTFDSNLLRAQNTANLIRNYESGTGPGVMRLGKTIFDVKDYSPGQRASMLKSADNFIDDARMQYATEGQFVDSYDPRYSSMTEAQKFMDNYPDYYGYSGSSKTGLAGLYDKYKNLPMGSKAALGATSLLSGGAIIPAALGVYGLGKAISSFLPINKRTIMENEARGAGIFTDDIGRIVTDDYNTAGGIMAGYNLNKIDAGTFDKRRATIEKTIADKKAKGLDTTALEERLGLLDEAEEDILGARKRTQQVYKMRADKRAADKARKEAEKAAAAAAAAQADANRRADIQRIQSSLDSGGYDSTSSRPDRDRGSVTAASAAASKGVGGGGYTASDSTRDSARGNYGGSSSSRSSGGYGGGRSRGRGDFFMNGGRVYYMDGGLADLVDIYD